MPAAQTLVAGERIVLMCAPNGARRTTDDHPDLPVTPRALAECAESLAAESVSVLHLHVRDAAGRHSLDAGHYRAAIDEIRARVGELLIIQATSEAAGMYERAEQIAAIRELRPEAVSLALREICPDEDTEADAAEFYEWLRRERIWAQHILYSPADVLRFDDVRRRGLLAEENPFCLFVLGSYGGGRDGEVADLHEMLAAGSPAYPWAACCFGGNEHAAMIAAAAAGGHVRIGFENNLLLADGSVAASNAELVSRFTASLADRRPATAEEIRQSLDR